MKITTETIDRYLRGELTAAQLTEFETELNANPALRKEVELQRLLEKGAYQFGLRKEVAKGLKQARVLKTVKTIALALAITIIVAGVWYAIVQASPQASNINYEKNETGTENWGVQDKELKSQFFNVNATRDTIIETQSGIVFQLAANSLLNKYGETESGKVEIEVKEAMTAADMIKAGLSTTSNGQLLETRGMFYINARVGNNNLSIDAQKPIRVSIPASDKEMKLFDGERKADGSINWINPVQLTRQLTTADIRTLDFYPHGFLDSLKKFGFNVKSKKITDSVYYSYSGINKCGESISIVDSVGQMVPANSNVVYMKHENIQDASRPVQLTASSITSFVNTDEPNVSYGEKLFRQNCAVCHAPFTDQRLTGPGLKGIFDRAPKGDWLKRYILNNEKVLKSGDAYANSIYNKYGKAAMTVFEGQLSDADVEHLLEYLSTGNPQLPQEDNSCTQEINPARIRAIWDPKFNYTILATKEFETRLKVIFSTCDAKFLNLYVQNLNRPLYELDSIAAFVYGGMAKQRFYEFYLQRKGGVKLKDEREKQLLSYFEEKRRLYETATRVAIKKIYEKESAQSAQAFAKDTAHWNKDAKRRSELLGEEITANLKEAYRQLGKTYNPPSQMFVPAQGYYSANITTTGWKNVDQYVFSSTSMRSTLNYTDPSTGKKAIIAYKPVNIKVMQAASYNRLVCYLIPFKLSTFQLMKQKVDVFTEATNRTLNYAALVVGYKGNKVFYNEILFLEKDNYEITLAEISPTALEQRLNSKYDWAGKADLLGDLDYQQFKQSESIHQEKINNREKLKTRIFAAVFPCGNLPQPAPQASVTKKAISVPGAK